MGKTQKLVGLLLVVLALGLAAYAWVLSTRMAAEQKAAQPKLQPVVVAQARIPAGSLITPEVLQVTMFPTRPQGSFAVIDEVAGKIAAADIAVGEAVLQERLGGGLRAMLQHIEPGERAVAVRVDEVVAVGNRLVPGDWVDVFVTLHRNSAEITDTQSRLLLERLQVLAFGGKDVAGAKTTGEAGTVTRTTTDNPKTAVLAVKIADVDRLILAAESGRLILALRPHDQPAAASEQAAAAVASVAVTAPTTQAPLTLKRMIASSSQAATPARPAGRAPARSGDAVIVMHGLQETTVRVAAGGKERP